jgi:hypothetical protein
MQITLSERTKASIKQVTGMTCEEISGMETEELRNRIETKIGKKLTFDTFHILGRGSVYQYTGRLCSFDKDALDKAIDSLK